MQKTPNKRCRYQLNEDGPDSYGLSAIAKAATQEVSESDCSKFKPRQGSQSSRSRTVDLPCVFRFILQRIWVVMLCTVLGAGAMYCYSMNMETEYTAAAMLYITAPGEHNTNFSDIQIAAALMRDYQEIFKIREVHEWVIEELRLPYTFRQLQDMITVSNPENTRILSICVTGTNGEETVAIANAYARAAKYFIVDTLCGEEPSDFAMAVHPTSMHKVDVLHLSVLGGIGSSILSLLFLFFSYVLGNSLFSAEDITCAVGIPTLAVLPKGNRQRLYHGMKKIRAKNIRGVQTDAARERRKTTAAYTEAVNALSANLLYCGDRPRNIMLTSRYPDEGTSDLAQQTAKAIAGQNRRTVLIETNLRIGDKQTIERTVGSNRRVFGLSEYLSGQCGREDILFQTDTEGAYIIPAGKSTAEPMRLLSTGAMGELVRWLNTEFDMVLLEAPPVCAVPDAILLADFCDGVLVVVAAGHGTRQDLETAVWKLRSAECNIIGAVLNFAAKRRSE